MSETIRIRTSPDGTDKFLKVKVDQDFDFIEILSLKISQTEAYETFCSDYGVVVGRVSINNGFGVPNAKVSIFIPITDEDANDPQISSLYPYETVTTKDSDGVRYNLLPKENLTQNKCYTPIGTFPSKREVLDNPEITTIYKKYYKYTAVTNYAGDYMLFGVPLGNHTIHVDVDISDIGILSQRPYDLIEKGTPAKFFDSSTKFKGGKNLDSLTQVKTTNFGINVKPFWGDTNNCEIGINRADIDLNFTIAPSAVFIGGIFGDSGKNSINKQCRPRKDLGSLCEQVSSEGTIEMIRKTLDNQIERFDVDGGRVIDQDGTWAYQIPMNLDYVVTDEFGNLVPSNNPSAGIPTRARLRFRIGMDEGGGLGRVRARAKYLVPHNPNILPDIDFNFDETTNDKHFTDFYWNKVYTVKNFIPRVQKRSAGAKTNNYLGIKDVDACTGDKNPFPYNRASVKSNILYTIVCLILTAIATILAGLNDIICLYNKVPILPNVNLIPLPCPNDNGDVFRPRLITNCSNDSVQDYVDCVSGVLSQELNMYSLNFFNDWINGSLYQFSLKYKRKSNGKEKFCDYSCSTTSNDCKNSEMFDNTVNDQNDNYSYSFTNGYVAKYKDFLYYTPMVNDGSNKKLFATGIVCLGAMLDCDWQGYPKIIEYFSDTSYNIPPLFKEEDEGVITTGMIGLGTDPNDEGLFYRINCTGLLFNSTQAANIRRQCEIGVDIPESTNGLTIKALSINEIIDTTISDNSISRYIRDSFYLLNVNGSDLALFPPFNTTSLNTPSLGTSFEYEGPQFYATHRNGSAYMTFRDYRFQQGSNKDMSLQPWGNSYFFYFGVEPGKSAFDKAMTKYFAQCNPVVSDDFLIDTTLNGNNLYIKFVGGTPQFTYTVVGTNYSIGPTKTTSDVTLLNLETGTYTIRATDSLGTSIIKIISV